MRSARFRPIYRQVFWLLGGWRPIVLGVVGAHQPKGIWVPIGRLCTLYYFFHFLVLLPLLGKLERPLPLPESISRAGAGRAADRCPGAAAKPMEKA